MTKNISELLQNIGAYVDQTIDLPTDDELTSRIKYLDMAQNEWANSYEWNVLKYKQTVGASGASVALPTLFRKLKSPAYDTTNDYVYKEIPASDRNTMSTDDKYVYILGNGIDGKYLGINPVDATISLEFDYLAFPSSLVTLADQTTCPNPLFLEQRAIAYVLESRSDPRFPQVKADAQKTLMDMINDQDVPSGGRTNKIPSFVDGGRYIIGE